MAEQTIGIRNAKTALVSDESYFKAAIATIERSVHHCLAMVFIVDPDPINDDKLRVDALLRELAAAAWRGVDARLIIGGSRDNRDILDGCLLARSRANALGVPARLLAATEQRSVHTKMLVADERVLLGSHNWSPGALGGQRQDSVLVEDGTLSALLASRFEQQWVYAKAEGFDVPR